MKGNWNIKQNIQYGATKLLQAMTYPFTQFGRKVKRKLNLNGVVNTVVRDVRTGVDETIKQKPASEKDYYVLASIMQRKS